MAQKDEITSVAPRPEPYRNALLYYEVALALLMMVLGLMHWSVIVGLGPVSLEGLSLSQKIATMYLGVSNPVAAVGLWMRVPWGRVIFIIAAFSEIAFHTAFIGTFGSNWPIVGIHLIALAGYGMLATLVRTRRLNPA
jgi:hypothetical protein